MTYIFVIIDDLSVNKVIGKGTMILEIIVLLLPYPGRIFLACRNQKSTIGRHDINGVVHLLQEEQVIGYVLHGAMKCVNASNPFNGHVFVHHVYGNIFQPSPTIFIRAESNTPRLLNSTSPCNTHNTEYEIITSLEDYMEHVNILRRDSESSLFFTPLS